jgi:uncharacterized protein (DUF2342 family)
VGGFGDWFKKLKKRTTIKSVTKGLVKVASALPVVGSLIGAVAGGTAAATEQVRDAQADAVAALDRAATSGTSPNIVPGTGPPLIAGINVSSTRTYWAIGIGVGVLALVLILRKR